MSNFTEDVIKRCRVDLGWPAEIKMGSVDVTSTRITRKQNTKRGKVRLSKKCFICGNVFSRRINMVAHMRKYHPGQFIECNLGGVCAKIFPTKEEVSQHLLNHHNRPTKKCDFCTKIICISDFSTHMKKHHSKDNLIRCSYSQCSTYFRSEQEKQKHNQLVHITGERKEECTFCSLFFPNNCMIKHLNYKHQLQMKNAFKCTFRCHRYFLTESERDQHSASAHTKAAIVRQEVECIYCNKFCTDREALHSHVKHNHSDVQVRCKFRGCSEPYFHTRAQLDAHFEQVHRIEEENKKWRCPKCDYGTKDKIKIKYHVALMHGERNKRCSECDKCFSTAKTLKDHLLNFHSAQCKVCEHCNANLNNASLRYHQIQSKCKKCLQILPCKKAARLHVCGKLLIANPKSSII